MRIRFLNLRTPIADNETQRSEIVVEDGRFAEILEGSSETAVGDEQWVDLADALVLPGVIDGHVHFDDPGFTHREDFASGTAAAAAGGVTTVVDMPCTSLPPVTDVDSLSSKLRIISPKAHVDFMLWGGVSGNVMEDPSWLDRMAELVDAGAAAIKIYMTSGMETFRDLSHAEIHKVLHQAWRLGIPVGVHAENREMIRKLTHTMRSAGKNEPADYAASRPVEVEVSAVAAMRELCRQIGARVHIVHVASGDAADLVAKAREEGLPMSAETCPHFLEFDAHDFAEKGSILKTSRVVKSAADRERLWQHLRDGGLSFVATDHAAGQWPEEKNTGSIWTDYGGVPGVELLLPYMFSHGVCAQRINLQRLTEVLSSEPARFFGIEHRKGRLKRGLDADFVVFDDQISWTVDAGKLHNLNRYSPLDGRRLTGRVRAVYLRGRCVYERNPDGTEMFAPAGTGQWVRRGVN